MNAPHLSTLAARFVENLHPARRILHAFPSFYMRRLFAAPVLPKLCGGMGTAQIQSARFYKGTVDNNGAINMSPWTRDVPYEIIAENLADGKAICHTINHKLADLTKVQ